MALILNVSYQEKDAAKTLGARWNNELKKWYAPDRSEYHKFKKWILQDRDIAIIVCDYFYIIEGKHRCFKCGKETEVIGFGIENYYDMYDDSFEYFSGEIHIASGVEPLSTELLKYLKEKYNFYLGYSKTTQSNYYSNHCKHCNVIQGDFYLFNEVDSPFFIDSIEKAKNLVLNKVVIKNDLILNADIGYGSEDNLIKEYGKIHLLNNNFNL
ncbi:UNVERIFIED_CONTAM: hypothetical protein Cloal_3550 [Acetivibrio alkalicellulosi]